MFHSKKVKKAKEAFDSTAKEFNQTQACVMESINNLNTIRKEGMNTALKVKSFYHNIPSIPEGVLTSVDDSCELLSDFKQTVAEMENLSKNTADAAKGGGAIAGMAGAGLGAATAIGGEAALWAAASAFGTTASGTAIGTLVGAAETNAFLAWVGGGAVAAGGGGVATGSTILAALGPVGWAIGGIGSAVFIIKGLKSLKKNNKLIEKINQLKDEALNKIIILKGALSKNRENIAMSGKKIASCSFDREEFQGDYNHFSDSQKMKLNILADILHDLCQWIHDSSVFNNA